MEAQQTARSGTLDRIRSRNLIRMKGYIDGKWVDADAGATIDVDNPATLDLIGTVPDMGGAETRRAIEAAGRAIGPWRSRTAKERSAILRGLFQLLVGNAEDLAAIMTIEQGKPLAEAAGEIKYGASFIEWFAEEAKRAYGETIPSFKPSAAVSTIREPVGVCGLITPWNFPLAMITRKAGAALAAGCTVVVKPSEYTPYSCLALAQLAEEAGIPPGVFNVVTGQAAPIGEEMCANETVRKISFTGSTRVGKLLIRQCADTVKRLSMELGGNAPLIVFADADIDLAAEQTIISKFRNAGQTCVCANRIYVQDAVYDSFAEALRTKVAGLKVGNGLDADVAQGPLIYEAAVEKVERHVEDAVAKGARIALGGKRHELGGLFFEPTVLLDVPDNAMCASEETFGPVAPLFRFNDEEEVVRRANSTKVGLASYFFTRSLGCAMRVSSGIEAGMVAVNEGLLSTETAPFGGYKESGFGREGSSHGIDEYLEIKYVLTGYPPA